MAKEVKKTEKADGEVLAAVAYLFSILTGIVVYLIGKKNFEKFHAVQSMFLGLVYIVAQTILTLIPIIGWMLLPLLWLVFLVISLFAMWKAYKGDRYKFPLIGDWAEKYSA